VGRGKKKPGKSKGIRPSRVLGLDPGTRNFAFSFLVDGKLERTGWVDSQDNVTDDSCFLNNCIELLLELKPDAVIAERYMFRGMQSVQTELISQMLGRLAVITKLYIGQDLYQISSSQWKNFYKVRKLKNGTWDLFPEDEARFEEIHQVDAACIAKYGYERWCIK
jgi:hypothetical protein